jgi:hypothetical protein
VPGPETIQEIAKRTSTVLLSYSTGKDSLATWVALAEADLFRIIPVLLEDPPGLEFVNDEADMHERHFGTRIRRIPSDAHYRRTQYGAYQTPESWAEMLSWGWVLPTPDHLFQAIREDVGDPSAWVAIGNRAADSINRRGAITQWGPYRLKRDPPVWYPIWDMRKADIIDQLTQARVPLGMSYHHFGRSYDGIDIRFLHAIAIHYPNDYDRIRTHYPLIDAVLHRHANRQEAP